MKRRFLHIIKRIYQNIFGAKKTIFFTEIVPDFSGQEASDAILKKLLNPDPCMIARFGSVELECVYTSKLQSGTNFQKCSAYIKGETVSYEWPAKVLHQMENNAGFFPATIPMLQRFSEEMITTMKDVDILGSWLAMEGKFSEEIKKSATVRLKDLKPFYHKDPWTKALTNKKVLVIHPFSKSIESQYKKRKQIYSNEEVLPEFELQTYIPVQSIAGNHESLPYDSWFDALGKMQNDISNLDFDIAIIGCGAYGFPLASFVKRMGKKSVHLGGATQLLFGIIGKRWEEEFDLSAFVNENWVRPLEEEKPKNFKNVEDGCYW